MGIDLSRFKVVYGERVLNAVALIDFKCYEGNENHPKIKFIDIMVVNADGNLQIITDEAWMFQFIPIITAQGSTKK